MTVSVPELPGVVVLPAPDIAYASPPNLQVLVGPPQVEFVTPPDDGSVRVVVGGAPSAPAGSGERVEFTVVAGFTVEAFRVVVPRVQEPNVRYALPNFLPHANRPYWVTLTAALPGEEVRVVSQGIVSNSNWAWAQAPIFLGPDGTLTQAVPEAPEAMFGVQIGYPVDPDSMYVGPAPAVVLA